MDTLTQLLRRLRTRTGLSQEAISARARLSETAYGKIEVGKRRPSPETLMAVLAALDCSPADEQAVIAVFLQSRFPPALLERLRRNPKALMMVLALSGSLVGSPLGVDAARPDNGQTGGILSPRRRSAEAA
jgi:transcriptional regulator with XRE-family HTH domain